MIPSWQQRIYEEEQNKKVIVIDRHDNKQEHVSGKNNLVCP